MLLANVQASLIVVTMLVLVDVNVLGFMYYWDIDFNSVTCVVCRALACIACTYPLLTVLCRISLLLLAWQSTPRYADVTMTHDHVLTSSSRSISHTPS